MIALLRQVSWPQWRHHPWRHAAALLAVTLGVALAFSVQLINQSALGEFSAAVRSVNGEPDFELRGQRGGFDEALYARVAAHPQVALASPVVELETLASNGDAAAPAGRPTTLRVLGIDPLVAAALSPALLPRLDAGAGRGAMVDPAAVSLNAAAQQQLGGPRLSMSDAGVTSDTPAAASAALAARPGRGDGDDPPSGAGRNDGLPTDTANGQAGADPTNGRSDAGTADAARAGVTNGHAAGPANGPSNGPANGATGVRAAAGGPAAIRVQTPTGTTTLRVHGSVAAGGASLAVMDIAGAQATFGWLGRLSRIDVRLAPGADRDAVIAALRLGDFAAQGVRAAAPGEAAQRVSNLSRAYRVNLTVLALVALFTGAFLVFSILALSVARRQPELALLGVLGLSARERLRLVLAESALLGAAGGVLGLLLGTALAAAALKLLAGDLGGGYFPGVAPTLHFSATAAAVYGGLGVVAALVGGWLPARAAQRIAPAQALKGLGDGAADAGPAWVGPLLLAAGAALCFAPPVFDIPLAAYVAVALLLLGGIACVPAGVGLLLGRRRRGRPAGPASTATTRPRNALVLLAVERARHQRQTATIAVAGVVASLSLAVALTVMVASFRGAITEWLDVVLPADLYARAAAPGNSGNGSGSSGAGGGTVGDLVTLPPALVAAAARLPGVARVESQRVSSVQIDAARPSVALIARPLADPARALPLVGELRPLPAGERSTPVYVSEAMVDLYGAASGTRLALPLPGGGRADVFVRGVWRDYARQFGAVTLDAADYRRLTGDTRINDLALWLAPGTDPATVQAALRRAAGESGFDGAGLEFASPGEIRTISLRIFDRSFAVTYWLQAVAIAIGLFGIAASFSAQVLARRKEFGLLAHLGLTRRQVLTVVAAEGAVWTAAGALLGLLLGIAVSMVLVEVVNPQSFHWTMELRLPWARLAALAGAVMAAGTLTAWLAARHAAGRDTALAVKEDW